jgi:hypothetical protein
MELNEIKKALYKEKPIAKKIAHPKNKSFLYETSVSGSNIRFNVPICEMGEKHFDSEMPAQLLIRWIV